jgi:hypothetical protein
MSGLWSAAAAASVQNFSTLSAADNIAIARTAWTPTLATGLSNSNATNANYNKYAASGSTLTTERLQWSFGATQQLPWGGSYDVLWGSARTKTNNAFDLINAEYVRDVEPGEVLGSWGSRAAARASLPSPFSVSFPCRPPFCRRRNPFRGRNLMALSAEGIRKIRGNDISMIFQEPMTSLNPVFTIGDLPFLPRQSDIIGLFIKQGRSSHIHKAKYRLFQSEAWVCKKHACDVATPAPAAPIQEGHAPMAALPENVSALEQYFPADPVILGLRD